MRNEPRIILACLVALSAPARAETLACENGIVTAAAPTGEIARQICAASDRALAVLDSCVLTPPDAVEIRALTEIANDCIALFHCGEGLIEILTPQAMHARRSDSALFASLPLMRLFESAIMHEIAHAAFDDTPCPFDACVASGEFFAYTLQIASLSDTERAALNGMVPAGETVSRDAVSAMMLYMAPDRFAAQSWAYLNQRGDICQFLQGVQAGAVIFDRMRP